MSGRTASDWASPSSPRRCASARCRPSKPRSTSWRRIAAAPATLGAFVAIDEDVTLAQARAADARIAAGDAPALAGVPIAHKDIFVTADFPTTAGSQILAGYRSPFDATVVRKLAEAGAVTLGKLNCDEFAMGSANENVAVPAVGFDTPCRCATPGTRRAFPAARRAAARRPWPRAWRRPRPAPTPAARSASRPRSAASPASSRPTAAPRATAWSRSPRASTRPARWRASAEDCALLLSAMCGPDPDRDSTSLDRPAEDFSRSLDDSLEGLRIGVPKEFFGDGVAPDVRAAIDAALAEYEKLGAQAAWTITLPRTELSIPVYYIIAPAEASSNLSRFDGVKFGHRAKHYARPRRHVRARRATKASATRSSAAS